MAHIHDPTDPNYQRGVQVIARETDRLYDMVEELLDFSRMQNGLSLQCERLDLAAEVSDAVLTMTPRASQEGLSILWEEPEAPVPVYADAARLKQVFINVLDNAVKYSPPGGTITVELLQDGHNAFLNFTDKGRGIAPEDLENVKTKFYKGKGAVRGSGIGLAVVDEIVTAHGGILSLQSEVGAGTTVTVRLPLEQAKPCGAE